LRHTVQVGAQEVREQSAREQQSTSALAMGVWARSSQEVGMFVSFGGVVRARWIKTAGILAVCGAWAVGSPAHAQTTATLSQPGVQVTDTTIRGGSYANRNLDGQFLVTRSSADPEWVRRAILKFDTQNTIPAGTPVQSATLTLTVHSGLGTVGQRRTIKAYRITSSFQQTEATWITRQGSERWGTGGGDLGEEIAQAEASNVAETKVTFDVTNLVRQAVAGTIDTRYTRIALLDGDAPAKESYRVFFDAEDPIASHRPALTVVYGSGGAVTTPPPPPSGTSSTLKVMQWNIHQGVANDGSNNIDRVVSWIIQANADLVSLNEIIQLSGNNQPQMICDRLQAQTGRNWTFKFQEITGFTTGIGEAVLSRLPIDATAEGVLSWGRSMALARVVVNGRTIDMISTHLDADSSTRRLQQVTQLKAWAVGFPEQRIVAGDFNSWPGTTEINEMAQTYNDSWAVAKSKGVATSSSSNPDGNTRNTRIDYVFYSKGATALSVTNVTVMDARASGISDHRAVVTTFKVN
jgi:endonuclease/exonuclease/phosphatase family metal-dependent hydrolase